jgi:hypothetical protein
MILVSQEQIFSRQLFPWTCHWKGHHPLCTTLLPLVLVWLLD